MKIVNISRLVSNNQKGYKVSIGMGWWIFRRVEHFIGEGTIWYNTGTRRQATTVMESFLSDAVFFHELEQEVQG